MIRVTAIALALCLLQPFYAGALHRQTPGVLQITPITGAGDVQNPRWGGFRFVVFDSDGDILGNGNTTRQIFVFDLRARTRKMLTGIEQLTSGPADARRGSTGRRARRIFYDALVGGIRQIFVIDRKSGDVEQLTAGSADSTNARSDERGRAIVFESEADFFGTGATGPQIFSIELRRAADGCPFPCAASYNAGLIQITNKNGTNRNPVTGNRGRTIVFESDADLESVGETSTQVYVAENFGPPMLLTGGPGDSRQPSVSRNGRQIAFESDADLLGNGSTGTQIFLQRRRGRPLEQVTSVSNGTSTAPAVSTRGRSLTFLSSDDLLGTGNANPNVFGYAVRRNALAQVTAGAATLPEAPAHSTGVFAAFVSEGDLAGNATVGPALYIINNFELDGQTVP